jgi:hypothetical protein
MSFAGGSRPSRQLAVAPLPCGGARATGGGERGSRRTGTSIFRLHSGFSERLNLSTTAGLPN